MIAGIEGKLKSLGDDWVIIDVYGINFRLHVPTSTLTVLGAIGDRVYLHTYLLVREDSLTLYGFVSAEEMQTFELLLSVSGVGPKVALSLLSALNPERFSLAIASSDEEILSSISGVGKKTAARIVLELKGKFEQVGVFTSFPHEDVKAALMGLGYSAAEAMAAISSLHYSPDTPLEDKIKLALRSFSKTG